jgi:hypothetical protein
MSRRSEASAKRPDRIEANIVAMKAAADSVEVLVVAAADMAASEVKPEAPGLDMELMTVESMVMAAVLEARPATIKIHKVGKISSRNTMSLKRVPEQVEGKLRLHRRHPRHGVRQRKPLPLRRDRKSPRSTSSTLVTSQLPQRPLQ